MQIFWFGQSMIKIETKESTVVLDPYSNEKVKMPSFESDIAVCSGKETECSKLRGNPFIISAQGEYEIKGIFVLSYEVSSGKDKHLINRVEIDNVAIAHLSDLSFVPTKEELEQLGDIDVLIIPVGGHNVLDAKVATGLIHQIEPKIVIPVYFNIPALKENLDSLDAFLKQMGVKEPEHVDKLSIKWQDFSDEEEKMSVVVLNEQI